MERHEQARWLPAFLALSLIWGSSFALIKVAVDADVAPVWVALWRCLFGALALAAITVARREAFPRSPAAWGHALVVALLLNSVPFALLAYGETRVSSVLAGMVNAATPLSTLLFALALVPGERLTPGRLAGLAAGFCGVLVMLGGGVGDVALGGAAACLGSTLCYGAGFAYTRRFFADLPDSAAALSTAQLSCATAQLTLAAPLLGGAPGWPGWRAAAALVTLGALGTGVAYILNLRVIREAGPTVASTVTYLTPLWSTLLGVALLSEPLGWRTAAGALLVLAGVSLARTGGAAREKVGHARDQPLAGRPGSRPEA
ncbi:DMT family transporter [Streptomyces millisiae]|uniref:DMT family transporter n=1 Tax=Streptomyces millisiae TaxID=3075542 RepID=A0ABU2LX79_9ACTN|nr:DMT family transporter [Streptomyces sp. DSM 44918]MDT0322145.1 DMT family transporter [Streptomyces sp. DSM 44918]